MAGVDEAGRGAWFGPVFAAAVILDLNQEWQGVRDSKQLSPAQREALARRIERQAIGWAVGQASAEEIDRLNLVGATCLAIKRAITQLPVPPDFLLVDALRLDLPIAQRALIRGDARSLSIAAASILAKVHRDACLLEWDRLYPHFGLARNKGYGTSEHQAALRCFGPTPQHRLSFAPVAGCLPAAQFRLCFSSASGGYG